MNGITIDIDPVIVHLGGFALRWYGLAFVAGIAVAIALVIREARRAGLDTAKVGNVAVWAVVGGLIGARLFHVLDNPSFYLSNLHQILLVNKGGLAVWGGLIGGSLAALLAARKEHIPVLRLADASALGLVAGQAVGRLGCIVNGDATGDATSLPWGFIYTNPAAFVPDEFRGVPTHPYPVYEILWGLGLFAVLLFTRRRRPRPGSLILTYVAGYALGRFALTFVRHENVIVWGLQQAQIVALTALVLAGLVAVLLLIHSRRSRPNTEMTYS